MEKMKQILMLGVALLALAACNKDYETVPPTLPPTHSFAMNYDDYTNEKSASLIVGNWLYSATTIGVFNTIYTASIAVPAIAFAESFNHVPEYAGEKTWQWSYGFTALGTSYTATLTGEYQTQNKVKWEMHVSKTGANAFTDFLWFEGTSIDSTNAAWTLYEKPAAPNKVLDIEWEKDRKNNQYSLLYKIDNQFSIYDGSTISFNNHAEGSFDRQYKVYLSNLSNTTSIEWNSLTREGRVMSPKHFNDNNWHCWNSFLIDTNCQ